MRRLLLAIVAAAALAVVAVTPDRADAWEVWCFDDPIISVNGNLIDVQVQMPLRNLLTMRSTNLTIVIPSNTGGVVVVDDISAFPMTTRISPTGPAWSGRGSIPITVVVDVTAASNYQFRVTAKQVATRSDLLGGLVSPAATAYGTANTQLVMPVTIGR
jgi:hypothetical protein